MTRVLIEGVSKRYPGRGRGASDIVAVDDVSISVESGEIHAIIGYSGAGKSTVLRLINGLERASSGHITVGDDRITELGERDLRAVRTGIGMIFQHFNLFRSKTVADNIAYPLTIARVPAAERTRRVAELLSFVGLQDKAKTYPEQLSGGQKQRVGIARALATSPGVLLADEATSALDPETSKEVLALLRRVNRELGITIVLITHEMEVVRELAQRVTVMDAGRAVEQGDVFDVFAHPQSVTARRFVATSLPVSPGPDHLAELRERHPGLLVSVAIEDGGVDQQRVFQTLAEHGVAVSIVHGGVAEVGGRVIGRVTLELAGEMGRVEGAVAALAHETQLEVLR